MKQLTRAQALQAALHHEEPRSRLRKPQHVLLLTCISCIGEGVAHYSSEKALRADEEVYAGDLEWYWTPIGYVCGGCAEAILHPEEDDDDA